MSAFCAPVFFLILGAAAGWCGATDSASGHAVPSGLLMCSGSSLVVDKSTQTLMLYENADNHPPVLKRTYACSTGARHGDKQRSGDMKTPEGVYIFTRHYADSALPERYGTMAFALDFPNYLDRMEGKCGNGIWLHGLNRPLVPFDSQGCIAVTNEDLNDLKSRIELYRTPIIIEENIEYVDIRQAQQESAEILMFVNTWHRSWQSKDMEGYFTCYAADAFGKARRRRWEESKRKISASYKFIDISFSDIRIFKHDNTVVVMMIQDYESDAFHSIGLKKLFLQKQTGPFRITGEEWKHLPPAAEAEIKEKKVSGKRALIRLLNRWISAWENKNLTEYIACYSRSFYGYRKDWKRWKDYKAELFQADETVSVSVGDPVIELEGDRATVSFFQKYRSGRHADSGLKTLRLQAEGGLWRITGEAWKPAEPIGR